MISFGKIKKAVPENGTAFEGINNYHSVLSNTVTSSKYQPLLRHRILVSIRTDTVTLWNVFAAPAHYQLPYRYVNKTEQGIS